ncbi:MAG: nucleotidyltransferase domain-containing protein [bacterium]
MKQFPRKIEVALQYLQEQVGEKGTIVLFGSRAINPFKKNADFDIGLFMQEPLSWRTFSIWKTRLEELAWPYRIDLVDLGRAPSDFLKVVKDQSMVLHGDGNVFDEIKK